MKKTVLLTATMAVMLAVFAGAAVAVNKVCTANEACRGTNGADGLTGTRFEDRISGLGGNDVIYGRASDDKINGGEGNDSMRGDTGNDKINGLGGRDSLLGNEGTDTLIGDAASDADGGPDNLAGAEGNDVERGGSNSDLFGNISFSGTEEDTVYDTGRDQFFGEGGRDRFFTGDKERDVIDCGPGKDTVYKDEIDRTTNCETIFVPAESNGARSADGGEYKNWATAIEIK